MSQENVEIARRAIEAVNRRGPDAVLDIYTPDVEFREDPKFPEAQTYRGRDAVLHSFREFRASFDNYQLGIDDLRDAGEDRVLALLHESATGRSSGLPVSRCSGLVVTFRGDRVSRMEIYLDPDDALEAVGLRE